MAQPSWRIVPAPPASSQGSGSDGALALVPTEAGKQDSNKNTRQKVGRHGEFSAASAESGNRPRRRRRRTTAGEEKKLTIKDPALKSLLSTMARLVLQSRQQTRLLMGIMVDTMLIPSPSPLETKLSAQQTAIAQEARRRRETATESGDGSHPLPIGPPTRSMAIAFLEGLLEMDIGGGNKLAITAIGKRWAEMTDTEIDDAVQVCRFSKAASGEKLRLQLALPRGSERGAILTGVRAIAGSQVFSGQAPPDFLEEELADWTALLS